MSRVIAERSLFPQASPIWSPGVMPLGEWSCHSPHGPLLGLRCYRQHTRLLPGAETVRIRPIPLRTHWSSRGQDSAPVMRLRGFESHPVLSLLVVGVVARLGERPPILSTSPVPGRSSSPRWCSFSPVPGGACESACGKAWYSACLGRTKSPVQIRPR